ncbi:hypothetical protein [Dyella silvatica]|uniref:hypothetical protein n=1 Tax=Dyella silvatica TaxID=2992128 RepID=UPI00224CB912|nr:hypothetical protein [Dyella silvatica]
MQQVHRSNFLRRAACAQRHARQHQHTEQACEAEQQLLAGAMKKHELELSIFSLKNKYLG